MNRRADGTVVEAELLAQAAAAFARQTGLALHIDEQGAQRAVPKTDAHLTIDGRNERLAVEIKRWAAQANLGSLVNQVQALPQPGILVADYVNTSMAAKLREQEIQFIDTAGNAYINLPPIYVLVTGNRRPEVAAGPKGETNRAFDRTGLKVVFAFLCRPELVAEPYREIAAIAGVAVGTVGGVINGLKAGGFVFEYGKSKKRELVAFKALLDRWVETYPEKLRPKTALGQYVAEDPYWWRDFDIQEFHCHWGGEIAAAHYTRYLKPAVATLYVPRAAKAKFLARTRFRAATGETHLEGGRVELYEAFWRDATLPFVGIADPGYVPPVLAYADLIATADPRNMEAARMIHDERLARFNQEG